MASQQEEARIWAKLTEEERDVILAPWRAGIDKWEAEVKRLEAESAKKEAMNAYLSKRVAPLSALAMLVLGRAQLPWEDDAALRSLIADFFGRNVRTVSGTVMEDALNGIREYLSSPSEEGAGSGGSVEAKASGEGLLLQEPP